MPRSKDNWKPYVPPPASSDPRLTVRAEREARERELRGQDPRVGQILARREETKVPETTPTMSEGNGDGLTALRARIQGGGNAGIATAPKKPKLSSCPDCGTPYRYQTGRKRCYTCKPDDGAKRKPAALPAPKRTTTPAPAPRRPEPPAVEVDATPAVGLVAELDAMKAVAEALEGLDLDISRRVIGWFHDRLGDG